MDERRKRSRRGATIVNNGMIMTWSFSGLTMLALRKSLVVNVRDFACERLTFHSMMVETDGSFMIVSEGYLRFKDRERGSYLGGGICQ